jgi:CheY-like chemotaxis protein
VPPPRTVWLRTAAEDGSVRVEVADNGPGVPAELRNRILEPFFTTKPVGAGTGLGLSVCHGIVAAYGGTIAVDDRPGGGACFTVTLPAASEQVGRSSPPPPSPVPGSGGDVLVVDDEPEVVAMLEEVLARDGHRVVAAPDGIAALALLREGRFGAVLCDLRMPRLDGLGLARELEAIRPDLAARLLLMTGDTLRAAAAVPPTARGRLLEKPLDPEEVRRRVRDLIAGAGTTGRTRPPRTKSGRGDRTRPAKDRTTKNGERNLRG